MFWVVKLIILFALLPVTLNSAHAETKGMTFLIIGQSISSNCNQKKFGPENGVNQYDFNGNITKAQDPLIWADCTEGSLWIPMGKELIERKITNQVNLLPIGVSGTKVQDWLPSGKAFPKLERSLDLIVKNKIHIDYILFYQGSSDIGTKPSLYKYNFLQLHHIVKDKLGPIDWIIAAHSKCSGKIDKDIEYIQKSLSYGPFYTGPDSNILGDDYRFDGCHLNERGQIKMANLWVNAIQNAINKKKTFESETLISFFRKIPL